MFSILLTLEPWDKAKVVGLAIIMLETCIDCVIIRVSGVSDTEFIWVGRRNIAWDFGGTIP